MAELDAPTLAAVGGFASVITGCLLLIVAWQHRTSLPAVLWGFASLMSALGLILFGLAINLEIALACVIASTALYWVAAARFNGHTIRPELLVAGPVAWLAIGFTGGSFDLSGPRAALYMLLLTAYLCGCAFELWRGQAQEELRARRTLFILVAIHAAFLGGGALLALVAGSLLSPPPMSAFVAIYLEIQVFAIGTAVFMVAMIKERTLVEERTVGRTDSLTGLPNRGAFVAAAQELLAAANAADRQVAAVLFDLDHFKQVNDSFGHRVGDVVLQRFAQVAVRNLRQGDLIGRIGGEEFAVLMPGAEQQTAMVVADRIRAAFAREGAWMDGQAVKATVSAGLAVRSTVGNSSFDDLLDRSDRALYLAKKNGRNRIQLAAEDRNAPSAVSFA